MRLHNKFMDHFHDFDTAKSETIRHWQSFVATQYLPLVARQSEIDRVLPRLGQTGCAGTFHAPPPGQSLHRMPHEFAIGFRFGHSQLRDVYALQDGHSTVPLFDKSNDPDPTVASGLYDLRGGKALAADHVVQWDYFLPSRSNLIDAKVNQVVFDLPTNTVPTHDINGPDDLNLPNRNLRRSNAVGLCAGEDLLAAYNCHYVSAAIPPVPQSLINPTNSPLFSATGVFLTPLWYYLLREAEFDRGADQTDGRLGRLGSLLVAEIILTAIYFEPGSFLADTSWTAKIPIASGSSRDVAFTDILNYVGLGPVQPI